MYDSTKDTLQHIITVQRNMLLVTQHLATRAITHDQSKLREPEKSILDKYTPILSNLQYGSDDYMENLKHMKPMTDHHYKTNDHHPEHHNNGVEDMSMLMLLEMLCDWRAASMRHNDGRFEDSFKFNMKRFRVDYSVARILFITSLELGFTSDAKLLEETVRFMRSFGYWEDVPEKKRSVSQNPAAY